jgi:hypothetical protein
MKIRGVITITKPTREVNRTLEHVFLPLIALLRTKGCLPKDFSWIKSSRRIVVIGAEKELDAALDKAEG